MDELIHSIENLTLEDSRTSLCKFISDHEKNSLPPQLEDGMKQNLWTALFKQIESGNTGLVLCLKAIRILSREKTNLSNYIDENRLKLLFKLTNISSESECVSDSSVEALKCLCNITYNLQSASDALNSFGVTLLIGKRLIDFKQRKDLLDWKLFALKLLFTITAFSASSSKVLFENFGLSFFTELCLEEGKIPKESLTTSKRKKLNPGSENIKVICMILKTAFNVLKSSNTASKEEFKNFVAVLREFILIGYNPTTLPLLSDVINVLTVIPLDSLDALTIPGYKWSEKNVDKCPSMEAVSILITYLDETLVRIEEVPNTRMEELFPVLLVLTNLAKSDRQYRKYIRSRVLPNLREVYTRPEVGNTLRNKLCRLLTCPITVTENLVADFLFVLCKESVGRMVKYTGYGNAAGLFANRGLLGGQGQHSSSGSEDSETEEYSQHKHMINPIVGCLTPPRTDETKDMTEEQKEYLAMELVNKIDKLQRQGVIQPCRVGPDGKPTPVEHVLELQENGDLPIRNQK